MARSAQYIDENGYLLVKGCPVSSYGIFDYGAGQVGAEGDPMRIVKVFRPESAINDPELIASLKIVPIIDDHDYLNGDPDADDDGSMAPEDKGVDGVMTENVYYDAPWLRSDLKIFSRRLQKALRAGKRDLSLGYTCKFTHAPGVYNGEPYEYVQTDMRGNHIALVDEARVSGSRVLDGLVFDSMRFDGIPSNTTKEKEMNENGEGGNTAELIAALQKLLPKLQAALQGAAGGGEATPAEGGEQAAQAQPPASTEEQDNGGVAAGEGAAAQPGEGEFNLSDACTMLEELLPKLKAKAGMGGAPTGDGDDNHELTVDNENGEAEKAGGDAVQGLTEEPVATPTADEETDADVAGKVSAGPAKGTNTEGPVGDAAMKSLYKDLAEREKLYKNVSNVVGAFDHSTMTAAEVAQYGVQKLGLTCAKGQERVALDSYFAGRKAAKPAAPQRAGDSANSAMSSSMAAYTSQEN